MKNFMTWITEELVFNFEKLVNLLSQGIDQFHFLLCVNKDKQMATPLSWTCCKDLSIDYVSISFILIWVKINV